MSKGFDLDVDIILRCHKLLGTGSRVLGEPRPDSDYDLCVFAQPDLHSWLQDDGWQITDGADDYDCRDEYPFWTARKGEQNIIAYDNIEGFLTFRAAHYAALHMKVTDRDDRVDLFHAVCGLKF